MCCRPCEGERRAGDNRKIRRAATYIVSFGMRNTRARGCRPVVADTSFTFKAMPFTGNGPTPFLSGAFCACRAA